MTAEFARREEQFMQLFHRKNKNLVGLANTRHRRSSMPHTQQSEDGKNGSVVLVAQLLRGPRTLHDLWVEWEFGSPGKKAAKTFTSKERGAVKFIFYKRKFLWDKWLKWC